VHNVIDQYENLTRRSGVLYKHGDRMFKELKKIITYLVFRLLYFKTNYISNNLSKKIEDT